MEVGKQGGVGLESGRGGVSSKRSIPSSTSLLIPKGGQFGGTGMGRGRESSSAFVNSFQGQKPSRAQTLNYPQQAPLVAARAIHSPLRSARTDCRTAWRRRKRGSSRPPPRGTSCVGAGCHSSSLGTRLENSLIKCHQILCCRLGEGAGGGTCQRTLDVNRYTHTFPCSLLVSFKARTHLQEGNCPE